MPSASIADAIEAVREGRFVALFDSDKREGETDLILPAAVAKAEHIRTLRREGGGVIFVGMASEAASHLGLPFLEDLYLASNDEFPLLGLLDGSDLPYDSHSAFSISVNHRDTYTGVTDNDRARTVSQLGLQFENWMSAGEDEARRSFGESFRTPGHVPICRARPGLLKMRQGHTELGLALLELAEQHPMFVGCEMLGDEGDARPRREAVAWAQAHGIPFVDGSEIILAWDHQMGVEV